MKKLLALVLALVMVLSFAACGESEAPEQGGNETEGLTAENIKIGFVHVNPGRCARSQPRAAHSVPRPGGLPYPPLCPQSPEARTSVHPAFTHCPASPLKRGS